MTLLRSRRIDTDVAIVGSGFAGSLLALVLRQRGMRVALLERGRHPRFAIGESSTPLAGLLIEELADRYDLPRLRPFSKWGTWQAAHPDVACGRKRGFSFFQHDTGLPFADDHTHARQLLVAASPNDTIADTHWYRPDFDHWLVREAEAAGVCYLDETSLDVPVFDQGHPVIEGTRRGASVRIDAAFLVDASGPRGFLWSRLGLGDTPMGWLPPTQALYAHFEDVERWDALVPSDSTPPYPVDDAALHHVLPGAWVWVLRFSNGVTSAGVAAIDAVARQYGLNEGADAWTRLLADYPSLQAQFTAARPIRPFVHAPRIAHRTALVAGRDWALLPSAAGVIDPLLSTGFPLTLLGIGRLARVLEDTSPGSAREAALARYAQDTADELEATERLVAALYTNMSDFPLFKRLTALYFAAASYAETVRRLGQPDRARGFLLHADPVFGPALRAISGRALALTVGGARHDARQRLLDDIAAAIAPFDVAGLGDTTRRDWYPVLESDLHAAHERLGVSHAAIDALLARCGFGNATAHPPRVFAGQERA
ncbi:2-octaprenyl-6-methoxyphenyl hydroxylase [Luteitalea pratensis]|uniref:2-octaprenyl-6-methoxyphenyl hydroxylase n=1 Tax=Luteitalea pratensis TaxID=1855912 RepID=A0A143PKM2_LUTPR|nr:FAD-dependent oxidoreductase [Luteitalea pratensis]AMY09132.1 2-octaprenyl-6-methoxyphenyl hydroxylase [Luteitalea pratensis]